MSAIKYIRVNNLLSICHSKAWDLKYVTDLKEVEIIGIKSIKIHRLTKKLPGTR